jgi:hypothetical protein
MGWALYCARILTRSIMIHPLSSSYVHGPALFISRPNNNELENQAFNIVTSCSYRNLHQKFIYFGLWLLELMDFYVSGNSSTIMALAGNKSDLLESRQVSSEVHTCMKNLPFWLQNTRFHTTSLKIFCDLWVLLLICLVLTSGCQFKVVRPPWTGGTPYNIGGVSIW